MRIRRRAFALLFVFTTLMVLTHIVSLMWHQTSLFLTTTCMLERRQRAKRELVHEHRQVAEFIQKGKPIISVDHCDTVLTSTLYVRNGTTILQTSIQKGTCTMQAHSVVSKRRHECTFSHFTLSNSS